MPVAQHDHESVRVPIRAVGEVRAARERDDPGHVFRQGAQRLHVLLHVFRGQPFGELQGVIEAVTHASKHTNGFVGHFRADAIARHDQ